MVSRRVQSVLPVDCSVKIGLKFLSENRIWNCWKNESGFFAFASSRRTLSEVGLENRSNGVRIQFAR